MPPPCGRSGAPRFSRCACPLRYPPHFSAQALRSCGVRQACKSRVICSGHPPPPASATTCASATNALPCCSVRSGLLLLMLDGGKAKLPRLDRRRSPPAPPPSVAAAVPPPPLLRRWRRRFWLRLGDQRKLINELPTGAPPVQLAAQLRPRVRLRRRRGFGLRRFFGAAGLGRPRCAPPRSA